MFPLLTSTGRRHTARPTFHQGAGPIRRAKRCTIQRAGPKCVRSNLCAKTFASDKKQHLSFYTGSVDSVGRPRKMDQGWVRRLINTVFFSMGSTEVWVMTPRNPAVVLRAKTFLSLALE